jgi:hypothetical protein
LAAYTKALTEHRARLDRLLDRRGIAPMKRLYDEAAAGMTKRLRQTMGRLPGSFTEHQHRLALAQLKQGQALISRRLAGELGDLTLEAQKESLRGLTANLTTLEKVFTGSEITLPVEEAARFAGVIDKRRTSLLKMHNESMGRYGARAVGDMENALALSLVSGEAPGEAIDRVQDVIDGEWWQAERIVRTETAWAYNATHRDGMVDAAEELDDLMMQWNEYVGPSGAPLDDRVGVDSLAMHGQVTEVDGEFTMPPAAPDGSPVSEGLVGESWEFPPNRPNDRAILAPWRPSWGIPGWQFKGGRRVPMR